MRIQHAALLALLIAGAPALSGCADFDLDKLDVLGLNQKKKLPGDRHAVFPEGVPGVAQGIPPELMKGQVQAQPGAAVPLDNIAQQPAETEQKAAEEKPKAKPKPKKVAARPARIKMTPQERAPQAAAQPAQSATPAQATPAGGWPAPANNEASPWPAPVPAGTFSKQQ
jgi:hypothetical protein